MKKRYTVQLTATVEVDDAVIKRGLSNEFRKDFYDFHSPGDVAAHIAYNMIVNGCRLTSIDGFADMDAGLARIDGRIEIDEVRY